MEEHEEIAVAMLAIVLAFAIALNVATISGFILLFLTIGLAFVAHELGHRTFAHRYGAAARFVMWPTGILLMLGLALFGRLVGSPFVFAAPGAVLIYRGYLTRKQMGLIALAGPAANIALYGIFGAFAFVARTELAREIALYGMFINSFLAFFNLLPLLVLDGAKVYRWDFRVWLGAFLLALLMTNSTEAILKLAGF